MPQDLASDLLRSTIEDAVGRKLRTPKDFGFLADLIFEKLHEHISPTTLKRFWGYLHDASSTPRQSTLDLLAQFIDYPSFAAFAEANTATAEEASVTTADSPTAATTDTLSAQSPAAPPTAVDDSISDTSTSPSSSHSNTPTSPGAATPPSARRAPSFTLHSLFTQLSSFVTHHSSQAKRPFGLSASFVIFLALLAIAVPFAIHHFRAPKPNILHLGTTFTSYDDYLQRFGLEPDKYLPYYTRHPEYPYIYFWGPEYHHPVWHNDGDSAAMMPTITEYYHPDDYPTDSASLALLAVRNKERYLDFVAHNPVLITFMKNLVDTSYVFLGVYVLSSRSDTTYQVWERIADDIDINHLERLERYHY